MRTSHDAQELAKVKCIRKAQTISKTHWTNIKRHEQGPRGGAMKAGIDNEHVTMLRELCELYGQTQIESFIADGILPDQNDLREILNEMEAIVSRGGPSEFWSPRPSTNDLLTRLAQSVFVDLANQVTQMTLEAKLERPKPSAYNLVIEGNVSGGVQVGPGNIQTIKVKDESKS